MAFNMNIPAKLVNKAAKFMLGLYQVYKEKDASIVEINPLVVTADDDVLALDAKFNFDENALYRHKDILRTSRL